MMLFAEAMGPATTRSSLEVMLDSTRKRDEQPKDLPPALPCRPTSRGRLPTSRRYFHANLAVKSNGQEINHGMPERREEVKESAQKNGIFGGVGLVKLKWSEQSPDLRMPGLESYEETPEAESVEDNQCTSSSLVVKLHGQFKRSEAIHHFLKKKLPVWCWLPGQKWQLGKIQSVLADDVLVMMSSGKILSLCLENILPANPEIHDAANDMAQLSYINEPSILHTLKYRYSQDMIYTKAGPVLVALNPFKDLSLYANNSLAACRQNIGESPHVFAVADQAYNEILRGERNQSIIISGESGSGKTETLKTAIQYLVCIGSGGGIDSEIVEANLILESFGNAKTLNNDNSSRFGKLTEIYFSGTGKICGAMIETFLLEKSRVAQRAVGERSYHVFYQLCAGAPPCLKEKLNLRTADEYEFLKQSKCLRIDSMDDAHGFHLLVGALDNVHISKEDQENIFSVLAAVLWLGNIGFSTANNGNHVKVNLDEGVTNAANLLGCEVNELVLALSTQRSHSGTDSIFQNLSFSQAIDMRDALAKSIYATLFNLVVGKINGSLEVGKTHNGRSISILDICGFEVSHKNGFDQFCINYANERMQQYFISHLLKCEQEEYILDGVDWSYIDFPDNVDCLNLFEKPQGMISMLDEESASSKATDLTFLMKLKQQFCGNPCFKGGDNSFRICHYSGEVLYNASGFLKKNRDMLHEDSIKLLLSCCNQLPRAFASSSNMSSSRQSAATKLKDQLLKLIKHLENTNPLFIRCIKPNNKQLAGIYEEDLVMQQLRCFSFLEIIRISRSGYPTAMTHEQFAERYQLLLMKNEPSQDPFRASVAILQQHNVLPDMHQVGYTKIFLRTGQVVVLEAARARTLQGILCIQKYFRGVRARCTFKENKKGVTALQSFVRAEAARREFQYLVMRHRSVVHIQKHVKQWIAEKTYAKQRKYIVLLQSVIKGWLARKQTSLKRNLEMTKCNHVNIQSDQNVSLHELKDNHQEHPLVKPSDMAELNDRVLKAEAELRHKEEENSSLRQQLQQYQLKWSDYDAKMKTMEEMWQKQMTSLQMSLAAAKKSLATNDVTSLAGRLDASPNHPYFDSEDTMSIETYTTEGTPVKRSRACVVGLNRTDDGARNAVSDLVKEFEQRKQIFEDDAGFLVEVKSGQSVSNIDPDDELRKLKVQFAAWKKDYKVRLHETKVTLKKLGNLETAKGRRKWWCKRSKK